MAAQKNAKPLRNIHDIEVVRKQIGKNLRNLLIFDMVTQTGLPSRHWLELKVKDISDLRPGDRLPVRGKIKASECNLHVTETLYRTISEFMQKKKPQQKDYVFESRKKAVTLSISSVSRLVKRWLDDAGFLGLDGLLTLRKTYELHFRPRREEVKPPPKETAQPVNAMKFPTRQEIICRELEKQIVMGILKPRSRLIVEQIAKQMGVSAIPVREALSNLEARGFITKIPHGGSAVRELSKNNLIELCRLRIMLECMAARNAALNRHDSVVDELAKIHKRHSTFRKIGDPEPLLQENKKFHFTIYRAANMPMLLEVITFLWDRTSPYHYIFHRQTVIDNPKMGSFHHEKILAGMRDKNPAKVSRWLKKDLKVSSDILQKLIDYYQEKTNAPKK